MTEIEKKFSLLPISFYGLSWDCHRLNAKDTYPSLTTHLLPSTNHLCDEESFAKVAMGWNDEGIGLTLSINQPFKKSFFPDISKGDSVEIFIDTRDIKTSGFNTRFCHHFFFLPEPFEGQVAGEITHFRTEDSHELCDPQLLSCRSSLGAKSYTMSIFIPKECLHGYDCVQFDRLGFNYRLNRAGGKSQHFSVSTEEFPVEQQPALWSSVRLVK